MAVLSQVIPATVLSGLLHHNKSPVARRPRALPEITPPLQWARGWRPRAPQSSFWHLEPTRTTGLGVSRRPPSCCGSCEPPDETVTHSPHGGRPCRRQAGPACSDSWANPCTARTRPALLQAEKRQGMGTLQAPLPSPFPVKSPPDGGHASQTLTLTLTPK